jgi:hypothetical protein
MELPHWKVQWHGHTNRHPILSSYCAPIDNMFRCFVVLPTGLLPADRDEKRKGNSSSIFVSIIFLAKTG